MPNWPKNPLYDDVAAKATATKATAKVAIDVSQRPVHPSATSKATRSRSYADLLDRLYTQFDDLATDIATSDAPINQKADALSKLARSLPLIQAAEAASRTKARNKDITALTDAELQSLVSAQLGTSTEANSPNSVQSSRVGPAPAKNKKDTATPVTPLDTSDEE